MNKYEHTRRQLCQWCCLVHNHIQSLSILIFWGQKLELGGHLMLHSILLIRPYFEILSSTLITIITEDHGFSKIFHNYCVWSIYCKSRCKWSHYMLVSMSDIITTMKINGLEYLELSFETFFFRICYFDIRIRYFYKKNDEIIVLYLLQIFHILLISES